MSRLDRAACLALDEADPLASLRQLFFIPDDVFYLDGNSLGALPRTTAKRVEETIKVAWGQGLIRSWNEAGWIDLPQLVGAKIAAVIGARSGDVFATDSTSVNLFKVLAAALAIQAHDQARRRVIVSERNNFPTDLYIAEGVCHFLAINGANYELKLVDTNEELLAAIRAEPAVVMITHVDYRTGAMHDMAGVTALAHQHGALVIWDLAHSAGAVPLALDACGADFAVGCGYKYLNGGPGAPAFVWCAPHHQARAAQPLSGWFSHADPFRFEPGFRPAQGVKRFLAGTPAVLGMVALDCGLDTLRAAKALGGMDALRAKSIALCNLFIELIEAGAAGEMLRLISPRDPEKRGSQVSFAAEPALGDGYAVMSALIARGVIGDFRAPNILRFGMTPLYTRFTDVFDAAAILNQIITDETYKAQEFSVRAVVT